MNYSYVMGVTNVDELKEKGFEIKNYEEDFGLIFSNDKLKAFDDFIYKNLQNGYWTERLGEEKVFIFKFANGDIKRIILNAETEEEILSLCCNFAECNFESIEKMLSDNEFYAETYYKK